MVIIIIIDIIITIIIFIIERRSRTSLLKGGLISDQRTDFPSLPQNAQTKVKSTPRIRSGPFFLPPFQFVYPAAARSKM